MSENTIVIPSSLYLDDLISEVNRGGLQVPAFQRQYVWNKRNVIELFESIYKGFPIGSLLFWSTDTELKINNNFKIQKNTKSFRYILDGQQRLTTLYNALSGNPGDDGIWDVFFDLERDIFIHLDKKEAISSSYFPLSKLLNTLDFIKESKRILSQIGDESLIEKAEGLAGRIRKYKLATISLEGGGLDEAIEIFTRLNRTGMKIEPIDLISALNYEDDRMGAFQSISNNLREIAIKYNFIEEENENFGDVILKTIRISLGFQIYAKNDTEKVADSVKSEKFISTADEITTSFEETIIHLTKILKFSTQKELPYINLFYMIFSFFFNSGKKLKELNNLIYKGSISGLFKTSPSETEVLISFFATDFDENQLTKKLTQIIENPTIEKYIDDIENGIFNAKAAQGKVTYNIIANKYLEKTKSKKEFLKYPPQIFSNEFNKDRLGNKTFFTSLENEIESEIFSDCEHDIMMSKSSIIQQREECMYTMIYNFLDERELI